LEALALVSKIAVPDEKIARLVIFLYRCWKCSPNGNRTQQRTVKIGMQQLQHTIAAEITARVSSKKEKLVSVQTLQAQNGSWYAHKHGDSQVRARFCNRRWEAGNEHSRDLTDRQGYRSTWEWNRVKLRY